MSPSFRQRLPAAIAWALTAAAAVSAVVVLGETLRQLEGLHDRYEALDDAAAERVVAREWVSDPSVWDFYRERIGAGDRYAIVMPAGSRRGAATQSIVTRAFAAFWLLPAVQVARRDANVVVFEGVAPGRGASCAPRRRDACVVRLRP